MEEAEDHKGFPHKLSFSLINPSKSDIGKISKILLDKINKILILKEKHRKDTIERKNTTNVIDCFKYVANKKNV